MMKTEQDGQSEKVRKTLRGRAEKACVRCRAKKRTCDGGNPCQRCKESHSACYFSDWHYTVPYPREYVEYLEEQQEQLSAGLMTMYRLLKESNIRTVPALPEKPQAQDLLTVLRGLRLDRRTEVPVQSGIMSSVSRGGLMMQTGELPSEQIVAHHQAHSPLESDSRSPTQPAMFVPQYRSPPMPHQSAPTSSPSPMQPGFSSSQYRPFEFGQPMPAIGPQVIAQQPHQPSQTLHPALAARQRWLSPRENAMMQEPWRHSSDSLNPGSSTPLDGPSNRPTPLEHSPYQFPSGDGSDQQQHIPQEWPWAYPSELGFYGQTVETERDSDIGLELESIGQRGDIVMPHDSQNHHIP